jgi:glutamine amidotransferase
MLVVVDYGMGNLRSVSKALEAVGAEVVVSSEASEIERADGLVIPGVGSFGNGIRNIKEKGLERPLRESVEVRKKPVLGICLGMQLMAEEGEEGGVRPGFGWLPGRVKRLEVSDKGLRVPHIGWDRVDPTSENELLAGLPAGRTFYFVHSYHLAWPEPSAVLATCDYGGPIAAVVHRENITGTQFHPEKSQENGLRFLRNFLKVNRL